MNEYSENLLRARLDARVNAEVAASNARAARKAAGESRMLALEAEMRALRAEATAYDLSEFAELAMVDFEQYARDYYERHGSPAPGMG